MDTERGRWYPSFTSYLKPFLGLQCKWHKTLPETEREMSNEIHGAGTRVGDLSIDRRRQALTSCIVVKQLHG